MMNFETIGGKIIEAHLRFADQWCDLNGKGWIEAMVRLYTDGIWAYDEGSAASAIPFRSLPDTTVILSIRRETGKPASAPCPTSQACKSLFMTARKRPITPCPPAVFVSESSTPGTCRQVSPPSMNWQSPSPPIPFCAPKKISSPQRKLLHLLSSCVATAKGEGGRRPEMRAPSLHNFKYLQLHRRALTRPVGHPFPCEAARERANWNHVPEISTRSAAGSCTGTGLLHPMLIGLHPT